MRSPFHLKRFHALLGRENCTLLEYLDSLDCGYAILLAAVLHRSFLVFSPILGAYCMLPMYTGCAPLLQGTS